MKKKLRFSAILLTFAASATPLADAAPYNNPGPFVTPEAGNMLPLPAEVSGKEFSQFADANAAGALSAEQVVGWDGLGGVTDATNFFGTEPEMPSTIEIDAIANHNDPLFNPLIADDATLIFSVGNGSAPTGSGTVGTNGGAVIGRAGDLSFEVPTTGIQGVWATAAEIDVMNPPVDVDGVELWGNEPAGFDTTRYSLQGDAANGDVLGTGGISVYCPGCGTLAGAYIAHAGIAENVKALLGDLPPGIEDSDIDLDAMLIRDLDGQDSLFSNAPDAIVFSIRQIPDQNDLVDGFYATGSEIFVVIGPISPGDPTTRGFLFHGGHLWDHAWTLANMQADGNRQLDINALEAASVAGGSVPEPSTLVLAALGLLSLGMIGRRRRCR